MEVVLQLPTLVFFDLTTTNYDIGKSVMLQKYLEKN